MGRYCIHERRTNRLQERCESCGWLMAEYDLGQFHIVARPLHKPAPWCRRVWSKSVYAWMEERVDGRPVLVPHHPASFVGRRLARSMDILRANQRFERQRMRDGNPAGAWT